MAAPTEHGGLPGERAPLLVGRAREQVLLRARLAVALGGEGGLVLLGGEAGIGKTALAAWVCREAVAGGALILVGRCYDLAETPPYGPWTEAFATLLTAPGLPALPAPLGGDHAAPLKPALFARAREFLVAAAAHQPVVLLLEDLHWADPASLDLLRFIARHLARLPLLLLATYRHEELTRRHPLYQCLPLLVREVPAGCLDRLDLRALDKSAVRALAGARYHLPEGDAGRLVAYLQSRAEGNPFFLGELLHTLEEEAVLRRSADGWVLGDPAGVPVPPLLRQVIAGRLARLGDEAEHLLAVAAIIGADVAIDAWLAVAGASEEVLLAVIERAAEAHLLVESPDGARARFVHALVREALYAGLSPARRRLWHRRAGAALAALPHPDPDVVAYHFRRAGDARAREWLVRAGEWAERAHAGLTAAGRFEAALALLADDETQPGERGWLLYRLARLRRFSDSRRGIASLEEVGRLAAAAGDRTLASCVLFERGRLRCLTGDFRRGLAEMAAGVAALGAPAIAGQLGALGGVGLALELAHCGEVLARWFAHAGRFAEARALLAPIPPDAPAAHAGHQVLAMIAAGAGHPDEARHAFALARAALLAADEHFLAGIVARFELTWALLPYQADDLAARRALVTEAAAAQDRANMAEMLPTEGSPRAVLPPSADAAGTALISRHAA